MTDLVQWNNCAGCMLKRSLLSETPSYIYTYIIVTEMSTRVISYGVEGLSRPVIGELYPYIYIYIYVCMYVCMYVNGPLMLVVAVVNAVSSCWLFHYMTISAMLCWRVDAVDYFRDETALEISLLSVRRKLILLTGNWRLLAHVRLQPDVQQHRAEIGRSWNYGARPSLIFPVFPLLIPCQAEVFWPVVFVSGTPFLVNPYMQRRKFTQYKLSNCMEHSPSWEADSSSASQEIPRILRNPKVHYRIHKKVHYRIHKSPSPVPILSQINPIHGPPSHVLNIHFNIILPFVPGSSRCSLALGFPHQNRVYTSSSRMCYVPRPSYFSWFDHPHNVRWAARRIIFGEQHDA